MKRTSLGIAAFVVMLIGSLAPLVFAQQPTIGERVIALKTNLDQSRSALHRYEWIETTVVSVNGEEKSRKQSRCYYGADGKLTKVVLSQSAPEPRKFGLRGLIQESEKEEMTDYMQEAVNLVHQYIPPDPVKLLAAREAGRVALRLIEPGKRAHLVFSDYLKSGDNLAVDVDPAENRLLGVHVNSYLDSDQEPVTLTVTLGVLNDGTTYPSEEVLDAEGKNLNVTIQNSGYRLNVQ